MSLKKEEANHLFIAIAVVSSTLLCYLIGNYQGYSHFETNALGCLFIIILFTGKILYMKGQE